jgi:hypothetical protein
MTASRHDRVQRAPETASRTRLATRLRRARSTAHTRTQSPRRPLPAFIHNVYSACVCSWPKALVIYICKPYTINTDCPVEHIHSTGTWPRPWDVVEDELRDAASSWIQWRRMRRAHRPARHPRRTLRGRETPLHCGSTRWCCRWVPQNRGWRRDPLYRGDGEGVLVNGEKK